MTQPSHRLLLLTIVILGIGLYSLDLYLPLGIGNGVLYGGLVVLSLALHSCGQKPAPAAEAAKETARTDLQAMRVTRVARLCTKPGAKLISAASSGSCAELAP